MSDKLDIAPPQRDALGPIKPETTKRGRFIATLTVGEARSAIKRGERTVEIKRPMYNLLRNSRVMIAGRTELDSVLEYIESELVDVAKPGAFSEVYEYYVLRRNEGEHSFAITRALPD